MVSQETNLQAILQIEEQKSKVAAAAAFEQRGAQFADADASVDVRVAERLGQLQQRVPTLVPGRFWQLR